MGEYYILQDKIPIPVDDVLTWAKWFENSRQERIVKQETVGQFWVSTVFLGLDHNWGFGPPALFETMVFEGRESVWMERTPTWELALEAHERGVIWAKAEGK